MTASFRSTPRPGALGSRKQPSSIRWGSNSRSSMKGLPVRSTSTVMPLGRAAMTCMLAVKARASLQVWVATRAPCFSANRPTRKALADAAGSTGVRLDHIQGPGPEHFPESLQSELVFDPRPPGPCNAAARQRNCRCPRARRALHTRRPGSPPGPSPSAAPPPGCSAWRHPRSRPRRAPPPGARSGPRPRRSLRPYPAASSTRR